MWVPSCLISLSLFLLWVCIVWFAVVSVFVLFCSRAFAFRLRCQFFFFVLPLSHWRRRNHISFRNQLAVLFIPIFFFAPCRPTFFSNCIAWEIPKNILRTLRNSDLSDGWVKTEVKITLFQVCNLDMECGCALVTILNQIESISLFIMQRFNSFICSRFTNVGCVV